LVLALDVPTEQEALRLADHLRPSLTWVKVGLQLFTAAGPDVVRRLVSMGLDVFLDLKLHDIPNTMAGAMRSLGELGATLTTIHSTAGPKAIAATCEAARELSAGPTGRRPAVLAVTVLTSLDEQELRTVYGEGPDAASFVEHLGRLAVRAGADGLVASPREVARLREALGPDPLLVIPGIRPAGGASEDQSRVATPARAVADGADLLVVGRPITRATDPRDALARILDEIARAQ
jgi:orotidine-5'-phosphate decarboxylase